MRDIPQAPAARSSPFLRWLPAQPSFRGLRTWLGPRALVLGGAMAAVVLVVVATVVAQREPARASFVSDVEELATFTAGAVNDGKLSRVERGEVERRAFALLASVQADQALVADLEDRDAALVASRLQDALTLLELYASEENAGADTAITPLRALRDQVQSARETSLSATETPRLVPSGVASGEVDDPTPTAGPRAHDDRRPAATPTLTLTATAAAGQAPTPNPRPPRPTATATPRQTATPPAATTATTIAPRGAARDAGVGAVGR